MNEEGARFDSGFDDGEHFSVSPDPGGVSLESALHDFGPAAIDDLIPRLRAIAAVLDAAHGNGSVHGALHPGKIFVTDAATSVVAGAADAPQAPYAAPEVAAGEIAGARADQFALAAIAYEWLFGRQITGPADRPVEVRAMPSVDRAALAKAFSRALARDPWDRFASCGEFVDAMAAAVVPELPLMAMAPEEEEDDPVEPFLPERPAPNPDDLKIVAEETNLTSAQPDLDEIEQHVPPLVPPIERDPEPVPVASWNPPAPAHREESPRFGAIALILATIVGAVFGFAAGYMARPRALQSGPPAQIATRTTEAIAPVPSASSASSDKSEVPQAKPLAQKAPDATKAPAVDPPTVGRLLVRSMPSGASVTVDGVAKGVTPVALRDLNVGTRTVVVSRRGYIAETQKIQITKARPARTLDVKLQAEAAPTARPTTPATLGRGAVANGTLTVDSRPTGASVSLNGRDRGKTPLTIDDLAPGEYRILMTMPGYRNFATTVRVVAGEHARAAASLTAVEQE